MPEIALRLQNVSHLFHAGTPNEVRALDRVDLELARGSFTVVVGANGSGKSSLLGAIAGSLTRTRGRIYLDGQEVTHWPEQRRAHLIGRVFQNPFTGTAADLTVAENLTLAARRGSRRLLRPALGVERRRAIQEQVARLGMGLEQRLDTPIGLLSGGQRQALTVLMATMVKPTLLLLDEHTAALDPRSAELVVKLTQEVDHGGRTHDADGHALAGPGSATWETECWSCIEGRWCTTSRTFDGSGWRKTTCCNCSISCAGPTGWMIRQRPCCATVMSRTERLSDSISAHHADL